MTVEATPSPKATDAEIAANFVGPLWAVIQGTGGPRPIQKSHHHFPKVFDAAWLNSLVLPIGEDRPEAQAVKLAKPLDYERPSTKAAAAAAYAREPRTHVYENVVWTSAWMAMVTQVLEELAGGRVFCTVYESAAGDQNLGPHVDDWYGAAVQYSGSKEWLLGEAADNTSAEPTVVMQPGDVQLLPKGLLHDVRTPERSVHLAFSFFSDRP
ncbi:MAG TPA: cupin domain-containing protein [Candidatus Saccharimonadales bacterium]|nr:cupin domain-containing protein [Candidatus Saccharimonadales bacterium]